MVGNAAATYAEAPFVVAEKNGALSVIDDSATAGVDTGCSMPAADWQAAAAITNKWGLAPTHITASDVSAAYKSGLG